MNGSVVGVLLAGGLARRFGGGDKCLIELCGKPLLSHVLERARPQVGRLILNANGDPARFAEYGLDVVADVVEGFAGPLAGILTVLEWTRDNVPDAKWVASFPTDAPVLPTDLVARLLAAVDEQGADMACAQSNGRSHPVIAIWPVSIADELRTALVDEDIRKIDRFTARYNIAHVDFPVTDFDPFLNINAPEDLASATALLAPPVDIPAAHRVGIIIEWRESANPWSDGTWHTVEVMPEAPSDGTWKLLEQSEGWRRYFAGTLEVELFKRETEAYKVNLSQSLPTVYVVLRPGEDDSEPDVVAFHATLSPYEADDYTESGEMLVDAVAMPEKVAAWAAAFTAAYHVDQPFKKRKQKRKSDSATGRGPQGIMRSRDAQ